MPACFALRAATATDIPALVALVRSYWEFERLDGFDADRIESVLGAFFENGDLGRIWIAEQDGDAAGYLLACRVFSLEHGGVTAEIDEFFVVPEHRGSGIGRRLLETAEQAFQSEGCTNISLQVDDGNTAARAFYARHGYSPRARYRVLEKALPAKA